jgi:hypothetical protein
LKRTDAEIAALQQATRAAHPQLHAKLVQARRQG